MSDTVKSILIILLSFFFVKQSYSDIYFNNKIENICGGIEEKIDSYYPKEINIQTRRPDNWYRNVGEIIKAKRNTPWAKIDSNLKSFFEAIIEVKFENEITCKFNGRVRLHGGRFDHYQNEHFFSLRVKIDNGHILNNDTFTFYVPDSRNGDNEIFLSNLFKQIGILSPSTGYINLSVNGYRTNSYIFQERHSIPFLIKNNLIPSSILSSNRKFEFEKLQVKKFFTARIDGGSKDLGLNKTYGINHPLRDEVFFNSLSKYNYILYKTYMNNNFNDEHYYINFSDQNFSKIIDMEKISVFDSILVAVGGGSGLEADDRRFYYDPIYDKLIPIYYDGMPNIFNNFSLKDAYKDENHQFLLGFEYLKLGAEKSSNLLKNIDIDRFQKKLLKSGLSLTKENIEINLKNIKSNLAKIKNYEKGKISSSQQSFPPLFTEKIKIIYNNNTNYDFIACEPLTKKCEKIDLKAGEIEHLLNSQILKKNGDSFVYFGSKFFNKDYQIKSAGLDKFNKIKLDSFVIFHNIENDNLLINVKEKKIVVKKILKNQSVILKGEIKGWNFQFDGSNEEKKKSEIFLDSCITFIDTNFKNVNFSLKNMNCSDSIKFIRSKGYINEIKINSAFQDALAADFSNLVINKVSIENARDDCINFKNGNYDINFLMMKNCKDRGVSAGLNANVKINNLISDNNAVSVYAKDSSTIKLDKAMIKNTKYCSAAYRTLNTYSEGNIIINKENFDCEANKFFLSKNFKRIYQ